MLDAAPDAATVAPTAKPQTEPPRAARRLAGVGFCLVMQLANKDRLAELLGVLNSKYRKSIDDQLARLGYVHYSRFVPIFDRGLLLIVTEFDGDQRHYVNDFAAVLDEEFSFILSYMQDAPRLPVSRYPEEFYAYVERCSMPQTGQDVHERFYPFSAYRDTPVMELVDPRSLKITPWRPPAPKPDPVVAWGDVQANVVRGFSADGALHVGVRFDDREAARCWLAAAARHVSWDDQTLVDCCVNLGFSYAGLETLGLPPDTLRRFPTAFRKGARQRAVDFEHLAASDELGPEPHAILTISYKARGRRAALALADAVRALDGCTPVPLRDGARLDPGSDTFKVHFGYVDNLTQPTLRTRSGGDAAAGAAPEPYRQAMEVGDLLLGSDYPNARNNLPAGELDDALARNATFGAFQVIEQHVDAFDRMLAEPDIVPPLDVPDAGELIAAKLLGRWRDGRPLADAAATSPGNDFDFWGGDAPETAEAADRFGARCPFGAHIRRLNPRRGIVVGEPTGRSLIRRALPYGRGAGDERGLVGTFYGSSLAEQFEFLQFAWADGDVAAPGLKGSVDPFIGRRSGDRPVPFTFQHAGRTHTLQVPRLTTLRAAAYLFLPGKQGLAHLQRLAGDAQEADPQADPRGGDPDRDTAARVGAATLAIDTRLEGGFNVADPRFGPMPHRFYAHWRPRNVVRIGPPYNAYWAVSYAAVGEALAQPDLYVKPGRGRGAPSPSPFDVSSRLDDGLFFMAPARHRAVRAELQTGFDRVATRARAVALARAKSDELLDAATRRGVFDIVADYAQPLATHVFMELALFGDDRPAADVGGLTGDDRQRALEETPGRPKVPCPPREAGGAQPSPGGDQEAALRRDPRRLLESWVRTALAGHDENGRLEDRLAAGTASFALRGWLQALLKEAPASADAASTPPPGALPPNPLPRPGSILALATRAGCPHLQPPLSDDERGQTMLHFLLGGFLSTEFLITTGTYNLLTHPAAWGALVEAPAALLAPAIEEMLRFDAPFMMADRWVETATALGGVPIDARSQVTLVYGSANRDRKAYGASADAFDITRFLDPATPAHHGFGHGAYDCIGAQLARWVAGVAFEGLIARFPGVRLGEIGPWIPDPYYRSLKRLTVYTA